MCEFIKSVIVKNTDTSFSGTSINDEFILISAHLIYQTDSKRRKPKSKGKNTNKEVQQLKNYWVIEKCSEAKTQQSDNNYDCFKSREAFLIGSLRNEQITRALAECFTDFHVYEGSHERNESVAVAKITELFTIYVLAFNRHARVAELEKLWRNRHGRERHESMISDQIYIRAAPFGSRHLINSYSQGIISNIIGAILLTDCPSVIGCEGGVVFDKQRKVPIAIVVSSLTGWRGEWTGLTLAVTFDAIFPQTRMALTNFLTEKISQTATINEAARCLVYINCAGSWGTGICIDKTKRLILTNAHVITDESTIRVIFDDVSARACVVYKTPNHQQFDLALLRCDSLTLFANLRNVEFSRERLKVGDPVFTLGFPLFSHTTRIGPSATHGHVSLVNEGVIMTTCTVLPGGSGGALCDREGKLVGVVTCNITYMTDGHGQSHPRVNMNIPAEQIEPILTEYIKTDDDSVLKKFILNDERKNDWAISKL